MSEMEEVLHALEASRGKGVALATIVGVRGSTYRREGARLAVSADSRTVGNISGGCLEGDVTEAALEVMQTGRPRLMSFDLTADEEAVWGWGLGCNGAIEVLVEPGEEAARYAAAVRTARQEERPLALVTILEGERAGRRLVVHPDGVTEGGLGEAGLDGAAARAGLDALRQGRSAQFTLPGGGRAFVEVVEPPLRLIVCGAGHDAIPLVEAAARLGWRAEVVDDREAFLTRERFPGARRFVRTEPAEAARAVGVDGRTYVVVMTHNFLRDLEYLRAFLPTEARYLGVLGPRARLQRLLDDLRRQGFEPRPEDLWKVHGPAGLDIGAEGPEEIAWAITAEIMAVRSGRGAGFLKDRQGAIHAPEPQTTGGWT